MIKDEIVSIEEIGDGELIDIEVSGNHLFFANGILTHNSSSDPEMTDIADSFALTGTADFMISLNETEQLEKLGQYMVKQLKNRYNNKTTNKRFIIGVDKSKMRLYDVNASGQTMIESSVVEPSASGPKPWDKGRKVVSIANIKV
jgi:hypothetical protein